MSRSIMILVLSMLFGFVATAASDTPDISKLYQKRSNCHLAYDLLTEEVGAKQRPADADIEWAQSYEAAQVAGKPCPPAPASLLARSADRVIVTQGGMARVAAYALKQNDPVALFEAGLAMFAGKFGDEPRKEGYDLISKAADMGDAHAMFNKGVWLSKGLVTGSRDNAAALPLIVKAAEAGHIDAMFNAGIFYMNGLGTAKDPKKSFYWYQKAAEAGHAYAAIMAVDQINEGNGVKKDFQLAYQISRNAAQNGDPYGMILAASSLLQGKDPASHETEILYWMDQAEAHGNATIRDQVQKMRGPLVAAFNRANAPPQYTPPVRRACPMKTTCLVDHYSGISQCTTNKDFWHDCDY